MAADFERAADLATKLLLSQRRYSPQIDILSLRYDKNITFASFESFCANSRASLNGLACRDGMLDGCTIRRESGENIVYVILYNDKIKSQGRRRFTLAHEIGHVYLDHMHDNDDDEDEADHFAAQLLLPPVLVWELFNRANFMLTAGELAQIFKTSKAAADKRLKSLKHAKPPNFSADETLLLKKFGGLLPDYDGPIVDC